LPTGYGAFFVIYVNLDITLPQVLPVLLFP